MLNQKPTKILRRPAVLELFGFGNTCLHSRINDGLIPPPCQLGGRAVGWFEHELETVLSAMAAGDSDIEVEQLVEQLIARRKQLSNDMKAFYAA